MTKLTGEARSTVESTAAQKGGIEIPCIFNIVGNK